MSEFRTLQHFCGKTGHLEIFEKYEINKKGEIYNLNYNNTGERVLVSQSKTAYNYMQVPINDKPYKVHRLILSTFDAENFSFEKKEVDHINRNTTDNYLENLRWADRSINVRNRKVKGVSYDITTNGYKARITPPGTKKVKYLGQFKTEQEAISARLAAEEEYGYHEY
jgi:hypothetical protein